MRSNSPDFEGGEVITFFCGTEIDLSNSSIKNEAHLELTCVFGGVDIKN